MREVVHHLLDGQNLSVEHSEALFTALVDGRLDAIEISALCAALRVKGETADEIAGAARALRQYGQHLHRRHLSRRRLRRVGGEACQPLGE